MNTIKPTKKIFGTDGVRGRVGEDVVTVESFLALGQAVGYYFSTVRLSHHIRPKIVIGKDTRMSNYMLEQAVSAGICSVGADSILLGPIPTPGISFITQSMLADAGIVISASHNAYMFNGLKIFDHTGEKITESQEDEINFLYEKFLDHAAKQNSVKVGKCKRLDDVLGRYIVHLKHFFPRNLNLDKVGVLLDCANGATYKVAPITFEELGARVSCIGVSPNGTNINERAGSTDIKILQNKIKDPEIECDVGFAFDGDGDRCIAVSKQGRVLDGDKITAIMAHYFVKRLKKENPHIVLTNMSNTGLIQYLKKLGCRTSLVAVGDRNVHQEMKKTKAALGSEPSGHTIFGDQFHTGDGILTAINVLRVMADTGQSADALFELYEDYPSKLININVREKPPFDSLPKTHAVMTRVQKEIGDMGKVFVRYSGTEPLARVMIEGRAVEAVERYANEIADSIREEIGEGT